MRLRAARCVRLAGVIALGAAGWIACASAETVNITASANAYVFRGSAGSNQDESQSLQNKKIPDGNARVAYVRFPLSSLVASYSIGDITSVTLRLHMTDGSSSDTFFAYGLLDSVNGTSGFDGQWTGSMTWNNQPAGTLPQSGSALPNTRTTPRLGSKKVSASSGEVRIPLDLQNMLGLLANDTNGQITLLVHNDSGTIASFASMANTGGHLKPTLEVVVTPSAGGPPAALTWSGAMNGNWNTSTANWKTTAGAAAATFKDGDHARFDDTLGGNSTVSLAATLSPGSITVNNVTTSYVLTGSGRVAGVTGLTKQGAGTLTLGMSGGNTFVGPVNVTAGRVVLNHATAPLGASSTIVTVSNGATLDLGGSSLAVNALSLANAVGVSGGGVGGNGAIVNSGASQQNALRNVTLNGDATFGGSGRWDIRLASGVGLLSTAGQARKLTKVGSGQFSLVGVTVDAALGDIAVNQGTFSVETTTTSLGNPANTLTVASGAALQFNSLTKALNKKITLAGGAVFRNSGGANVFGGAVTLAGNATFDIGGTSLTLSAPMAGAGGFTKTGSGTLVLTGTQTFSGAVAVNAGVLTVNGQLAGGGSVTVGSGGTFSGSVAHAGPMTVSGKLQPGDVNTAGTFATGGLTLATGATVAFEMGATNTVGGGLNDLVQVNGNLVLNNNTIAINPLSTPQIGVPYRLVNYTGTLTGAFNPALDIDTNYFNAHLDYGTPGQINLIFTSAQSFRIPAQYPTGSGTPNVTVGADGKLVYSADANGDTIPDFSSCGYGGGGVPIPDVPVVTTLSPVAGNNQPQIQAAINAMASRPMDVGGFRGAILLNAGTYTINTQITMNVSGVVLRGSGTNATILSNQTSGEIISVGNGSNSASEVSGSRRDLIDSYVPVGAKWFRVASTSGLAVGDTVIVVRPSTQNWLDAIGTSQYGWSAGSYNMPFDRTIVAIEDNRILLDAPLSQAIDATYGGGYVYKYSWTGRLRNVGIENFQITGSGASFGVNHLMNGWIRKIFINKVGGHGLWVSGGKWQTFQDIVSNKDDPNPRPAAPPSYFSFDSHTQLSLFHRLSSTYGGHDFSSGARVSGPNVYLECWSQSYSDSGPHHRWAVATLYDSLRCGQALTAKNAGGGGTGHGWTGANHVLWNCQSSSMRLDRPATAHQWSIGPIVSGSRTGTSTEWISVGTHVQPGSLYRAQLAERVGRAQSDAALGQPDGSNYFELWAASDTISVAPGQSANQALRVNYSGRANGQAVSLSVSGLPAGLTAGLSKSSFNASGDAALTVTASSAVPAGAYRLKITGAGGFPTIANTTATQTRTRDFVVRVGDTSGNFSVAATPASRTVVAPGAETFTVQVSGAGGFSGSVGLSVTGLPPGATASFAPSAIAGSGFSTLSVNVPDGAAGGGYSLLIAGSNGGETNGTTVTLNVASSALPDPWTDLDVGEPALKGSATFNGGTGVFTVAGGGVDIWGTSDQFHFVHSEETGDFTLTARVASQTNTHAFAKAGVMVRETTAANSKYVAVLVTPTSGIALLSRSSVGGASQNVSVWGAGSAPYWVRLVRSGNTFTGFKSADGQSWTQVAQTAVTMSANVFAGLAVTAHDNTKISTAVFDGVSVVHPDFELSTSPDSHVVNAGDSATFTVSMNSLNSFNGAVALGMDDLPAGVTATFNPTSISGSQTSVLTLTTSNLARGGSYELAVTGTSGGLARGTFAALEVNGAQSGGDGIPDWWRIEHFGHPTGQAAAKSRAEDDADGDSHVNIDEYLSGTDPNNAASYLHMKSVAIVGDDVRVTWAAIGGRMYFVEAVSDLNDTTQFEAISPPIEAGGEGDVEADFLDVGGAAHAEGRFYRVRIAP